ncbi:tetratricopeptide repeat protein [Pleionea litopenaei]|uniref:Tetratricopeptide repeat protein n=1 Tax=Pleionea litopenaei TaxID=3070815 RepID=A0AA51X6B9_9GAMM|nr:tetratricopeptide repeat protein [Pleionea sp. HL-JVS1]WMS85930.1 tetratricopeptide repeat protein [Pleionea sp. HL-JVS1]
MAGKLLGILCLVLGTFAYAGNSSYRQGGTSIYFTQLGHLKHQAELGDPNAQFLLGNLYLSPPADTSVRQNLPKAVDYYFQAAIRNHAGAQYNLGVLYYRGTGVKESKMMASVWFTLAAENASPVAKNVKKNAQSSLIDLKSMLTEKDKEAAEQWLEQFKLWINNQNYRLAKIPDDFS